MSVRRCDSDSLKLIGCPTEEVTRLRATAKQEPDIKRPKPRMPSPVAPAEAPSADAQAQPASDSLEEVGDAAVQVVTTDGPDHTSASAPAPSQQNLTEYDATPMETTAPASSTEQGGGQPPSDVADVDDEEERLEGMTCNYSFFPPKR